MAVHINRERGAVSLEFALVCKLLLVSSIILIELMRVAFVGLSLQFASNAALRRAVVGAPQEMPEGSSREAEIENRALAFARAVGIDIGPEHIRICPATTPNCIADNAGMSGEFITVTIQHRRRLLFIADIVLTAESIGRNEPF